MSTFKNARILCGLSRADAANFLGVSPETVKKWDQGKTRPPRGVWEMLAERMRISSLQGKIRSSLSALDSKINLVDRELDSVKDSADFAADHMFLEGIDPRAWANITATCGDPDALDAPGKQVAGALGLLMAVDDLSEKD